MDEPFVNVVCEQPLIELLWLYAFLQRAFFAVCGAFSFYLFDLMHMLLYTLWCIYFIASLSANA